MCSCKGDYLCVIHANEERASRLHGNFELVEVKWKCGCREDVSAYISELSKADQVREFYRELKCDIHNG